MTTPGANQHHELELEARVTSITEKVDAMAVEFERSQSLAKERHEAIQARFVELTRLVTGEREVPTRPMLQSDVEAEGSQRRNQLDIPFFEGTDAFVWFETIESLFDLGNYSDEEKVDMVSWRLSGRALRWYKWEVRHIPFANWVRFKEKVLMRFGSFTSSDSAQEQESSIQAGLSSEMPLILEEELETKRTIEAQLILDSCSIQAKKSGEATDLILSTDLFPQMKLPHLQVPPTSLESSHQDDSLGDYRMKWEAVIRNHVVKTIENPICDDVHEISSVFREELPHVQEVALEFQTLYNGEIKSYAPQLFDRMILREQQKLFRKMKCSKSWRFKFKTNIEQDTWLYDKLWCGENAAAILQAESKFQMKPKFSSFALEDKLHFSNGSIIDKSKAKTQGRDTIESQHLTFKTKLGRGSKCVWVSFCSIWHRWRVKSIGSCFTA